MPKPVSRAAQYLRMSTDRQEHSVATQASAIAAFAQAHGLDVVRTYVDEGASGLTVSGRPGLGALMADVLGGTRDFSTVLVADVSRWGRFQDLDEAAHYEFLCREAGVALVYCCEPDDISEGRMSPLVKQLKRVLAAEYSRERSEAVRQAARAGAAMGRKQGGRPPIGLRRALHTAEGEFLGLLEQGEGKLLIGQSVRFAHGPDEEVRVVREIFRRFTDQRQSSGEIALALQQIGAPRPGRGPWSRRAVLEVVRHELYVGTYVFGRRCGVLRGSRRTTPQSDWVRAQVVAPIVSREQFAEASSLARPRRRHTEDELLAAARRLLDEKGRLSGAIIDGCPFTAAQATYKQRFGGLAGLYRQLGYVPGSVWRRSEASLLEALRALGRRHGFASGGLLSTEDSAAHPATYHRRFGSLSRAYELAGLSENILRGRRVRAERRRAARTVPTTTGSR